MGRQIAVDLGATNTRAAIINKDGRIEKKIEELTPFGGDSPSLLTGFLTGLITYLAGSTLPDDILGIGLSVAGPVDIDSGVLVNPPNMTFRNVPVTGPLSLTLNRPVRMVNDCHAGLLGEVTYGQGRGRENVVYITISTGIGGGVMSRGRVVLGRDGNAAEIGHFHVDSTYNLTCGCGNTGHWEGYSSGRFIPAFYSVWCKAQGRPARDLCTAEEIFSAARQGDGDVMHFISALVQIIARGLSDVIVAYDPEVIILDGSVIRANADLLFDSVIAAVDRYLPLPDIVLTGLDGSAPLLGAAVIARGYDTPFGSFCSTTR
jgi:glucokinase